MGELRYRDPVTSTWLPIQTVGAMGPSGATGPAGPTGPTGLMGISTVIIGSFGSGTGTPATLPPTGALVAGFTAPGSTAYQMVIGESLYYEAPAPADPLDGHLYQYVGTATDPSGWVDIGLIQGPPGPSGPLGPTGPQGPTGDEISIGTEDPFIAEPTGQFDMWYDTDDPYTGGNIPTGGRVGEALTKITAADYDTQWAGQIIVYNPAYLRPYAANTTAGTVNDNVVGCRSDGKGLYRLQSSQAGYVGGNTEGTMRVFTYNGGWGGQECFKTQVSSPASLWVNGLLTAGDVLDRSALVTKRDVADLDPDVAGRLIDALRPITYERIIPQGENQTVPSPPFRRVGFAVEDMEGAAAIDGLVRPGGQSSAEPGVDTNPDERGYSIPGLLAVAISEIKRLRAEVDELKRAR